MPAEIQTQFFKTGNAAEPVKLRDGGLLPGITLAYETWGTLNPDRSNVIFLFHALSGSHHAAGKNTAIEGVGELWQPEMHDGWWENMIGPGKAVDTRLLRESEAYLRSRGCESIALTLPADAGEDADLFKTSGYRVLGWELERTLK